MSVKAGLAEHVDFKVGDAVETINALTFAIDFVLVDLWKDLYTPCLEAFYPKLQSRRDHRRRQHDPARRATTCRATPRRSAAKPGMETLQVPVGSGLEISRFRPGLSMGSAPLPTGRGAFRGRRRLPSRGRLSKER